MLSFFCCIFLILLAMRPILESFLCRALIFIVYFTLLNNLASASLENHIYSYQEAYKTLASHWPHLFPNDKNVARAGFYLKPHPIFKDSVSCPVCHIGLNNWEITDDPLDEHLRHRPNCPLAIAIKNGTYSPYSNKSYPPIESSPSPTEEYRHPQKMPPYIPERRVVLTWQYNGKTYYKFGKTSCPMNVDPSPPIQVIFDNPSSDIFSSDKRWGWENITPVDDFLVHLGLENEAHFNRIVGEITPLMGNPRIKQLVIEATQRLRIIQEEEKNTHRLRFIQGKETAPQPQHSFQINATALYINILLNLDFEDSENDKYKNSLAQQHCEQLRRWGVNMEIAFPRLLRVNLDRTGTVVDQLLAMLANDYFAIPDFQSVERLCEALKEFFPQLKPRHLLRASVKTRQVINDAPPPRSLELFFILALDMDIRGSAEETTKCMALKQRFLAINGSIEYWLRTLLNYPDIENQGTVEQQVEYIISALQTATINYGQNKDLLYLSQESNIPHLNNPTLVPVMVNLLQKMTISTKKHQAHTEAYPQYGSAVPGDPDDKDRVFGILPDYVHRQYVMKSQTDKKGSESKLYLLEEIETGKQFILKKLKLRTQENGTILSKLLTKIKNAQIQNTDENLDFIVRINFVFYDKDVDNQHLYLIEEFHPENLHQWLEKQSDNEWGKTVEQPVSAKFSRQITKGLQWFHRHGFIHRDIKLTNILITKDGNICITDFGSLTHIPTILENIMDFPPQDLDGICHSVWGTRETVAPEVIPSEPGQTCSEGYGNSSEIWSLASVLWQIHGGKNLISKPDGISRLEWNQNHFYHLQVLNEVFPKSSTSLDRYEKLRKINPMMPDYVLRICAVSFDRIPSKRALLNPILEQLENTDSQIIILDVSSLHTPETTREYSRKIATLQTEEASYDPSTPSLSSLPSAGLSGNWSFLSSVHPQVQNTQKEHNRTRAAHKKQQISGSFQFLQSGHSSRNSLKMLPSQVDREQNSPERLDDDSLSFIILQSPSFQSTQQ